MNISRNIRFFLQLFLILCVLAPSHLFAQDQGDAVYDVLFSKLTGVESKKNEALKYISKKKPVQLIPRIARAILKADDIEERDIYIQALKFYRKDSTILYWIDILRETGSFPFRIEMIKYLGSLGDRRIVLPVARQLENRFSAVRKEAGKVLRRNGDDRIYPFILRMAGSRNPVKRIYALEAMQILYDMRFYTVITELVEDPVKSVRIYALKCIEKNHLKKGMYLVKKAALKDADREVRIAAIRVIGTLKDHSASFVLTRSLSDRDRDIRYAAARSLYRIHLGGTAFALSNQLMVEEDREIKYILLETMLKINRTGNVAALKKILSKEENFRLRILAAHVLGKITNDRNLDLLLKYKNDTDYRVRAEIAGSLGSYRSAKSQKGLFKLIKGDNTRYVRSAALFSLCRINDRSSIVPLFDQFSNEKDYIFREQLRQTLRTMIKHRV